MTFTRDHVEAACCLWEAMLEMRKGMPELDSAFQKHGTSEMRLAAIDLSPIVDGAWQKFTEDEREKIGAFDWEFCPRMVRKIDWAQWPPTFNV